MFTFSEIRTPPADVGNWVSPYGGLVPRVGTNLGPLRLDAGVLLGGGLLGRQVAGTSGTLLEIRPIWRSNPGWNWACKATASAARWSEPT